MTHLPTARVFPWQSEPFKLWSLWDMMQIFVPNLCSALMYVSHTKAIFMGKPDDKQNLGMLLEALEQLRAEIDGLALSHSLKLQAGRLAGYQPHVDPKGFGMLVTELEANLVSELSSHLFLCVPHAERVLFEEPERWFGEDTMTVFPDSRAAARDCGKCLALDQGTAAVFHAMCVAEYGLRRLSQLLDVTFPGPIELENWKNIIDKIEAAIRLQEQLPKSEQKSSDLEFFAKAASHFFYLKEAWRNHVSHAHRRYDNSEARQVAEHVRDFMAQLATRTISAASSLSP